MTHADQPVIVSLLTVVQRGDAGTFRALEEEFAREPVRIIWDRRTAERRRARKSLPERRQSERRREPPTTWTDSGFVIVEDPSRLD
jgi:hypothetical protein